MGTALPFLYHIGQIRGMVSGEAVNYCLPTTGFRAKAVFPLAQRLVFRSHKPRTRADLAETRLGPRSANVCTP